MKLWCLGILIFLSSANADYGPKKLVGPRKSSYGPELVGPKENTKKNNSNTDAHGASGSGIPSFMTISSSTVFTSTTSDIFSSSTSVIELKSSSSSSIVSSTTSKAPSVSSSSTSSYLSSSSSASSEIPCEFPSEASCSENTKCKTGNYTFSCEQDERGCWVCGQCPPGTYQTPELCISSSECESFNQDSGPGCKQLGGLGSGQCYYCKP